MDKPKSFQNKKENWKVTAERFVAFIDIMGFKDMVLKQSHEQIYDMMKKIDSAKSNNESLSVETAENLIKTTTYSDSIVIYTKDNTISSFKAIIACVSGLTNDLFLERIPHKGALAFGVMTLDTEKSIFFGQPLIDAYLLQEELFYYGMIVHGTVEEKMFSQLNKTYFLIPYNCPLKNGKSTHYTIYPMHIDSQSAKDYSELHKSIQKSLEEMKFKTSGNIRRYIDNTNEYFSYVSENN